jgi:hypothetical protein
MLESEIESLAKRMDLLDKQVDSLIEERDSLSRENLEILRQNVENLQALLVSEKRLLALNEACYSMIRGAVIGNPACFEPTPELMVVSKLIGINI